MRGHRRDDNQTLRDILGESWQSEKEHELDYNDQEQAADQRAAHGTLAAQESDSAENGSSDRLQCQPVANQRITGAGLRSDEEPGERAKPTGDRIRADLRER